MTSDSLLGCLIEGPIVIWPHCISPHLPLRQHTVRLIRVTYIGHSAGKHFSIGLCSTVHDVTTLTFVLSCYAGQKKALPDFYCTELEEILCVEMVDLSPLCLLLVNLLILLPHSPYLHSPCHFCPRLVLVNHNFTPPFCRSFNYKLTGVAAKFFHKSIIH